MREAQTHVVNQRSLVLIVLIAGIVGGLLIAFSILLLCKYCLNRKNLKQTERMKLFYEILKQTTINESNRFYQHSRRDFSSLEPRRSNPLDRYQLPQSQWQIMSNSQEETSNYHSLGSQTPHNRSNNEVREHLGNQQRNLNVAIDNDGDDDDDDDQAYLKVDPRCYVRQNSNTSLTVHRKSDTPRLEKGHSINVDTRSSTSSTSLSPYRQSSFDVTLVQAQLSPASPSTPTQQDMYFTPRGSILSIMGNPVPNTSINSQHLSPPISSTNQTSNVHSLVVGRQHEHFQSLQHSTSPLNQQLSLSNNATNDKQSRSFDAVHLLRPCTNRADAVNRRTRSYEYDNEQHSSTSSVSPAPIIIKIPDMTQLIQAAQQQNRRENCDIDEYQKNTGHRATLVQQISINDDSDNSVSAASRELWRLRKSLEIEERQKLSPISPEDFSQNLRASTSINSIGVISIHNKNNYSATTGGGGDNDDDDDDDDDDADDDDDDDRSEYHYRRKNSSNLLLPPPEVRRQALRYTFEKRRYCINQSNKLRDQEQSNHNQMDLDENNVRNPISDFSNLLKNFNSRSETSSFERSLETDFDIQSDTSSRGLNDPYTSIESSGNENPTSDMNSYMINKSPRPTQQNDSGYKSLESEHSQNRTSSFDWMSADGAESVVYVGDRHMRKSSVNMQDLDDDLAQQKLSTNTNRRNSNFFHNGHHHSYQEASTNLVPPVLFDTHMTQQRSLSTNIPFVENNQVNYSILSHKNQVNSTNRNNNNDIFVMSSSSSFVRTASKKRREFGKGKRNVSSNVGLPHLIVDEQQPKVHQSNETNPTVSSALSLQVRYPDLRRTKSDESRSLAVQDSTDSSLRETISNRNETKSDTHLFPPTDEMSGSISSSNPIQQHLTLNITNQENSHHALQCSPSSAILSATSYSHAAACRSQCCSVSFDNQTSFISSPKRKKSSVNSFIPMCITKPRLKLITVRNTATENFVQSAPVYSMPITRDYSIDEKTNRIVNEFLTYDPSYDDCNKMYEDDFHRRVAKRHHRIKQRAFDDTIITTVNNTQKQSQQQIRSPVSKQQQQQQRHYNTSQTNIRKFSHYYYPTISISNRTEHEEDSSESTSPSSKTNQQPVATIRQKNSITVDSPSIIITGDDSGSQS